jgi:hypothetical protein
MWVPGFSKLACNAAKLDNWHSSPEGNNKCHLQQQAVEVSDVICIELSECFRTVSSLEMEVSMQVLQLLINPTTSATKSFTHLHDEAFTHGDLR